MPSHQECRRCEGATGDGRRTLCTACARTHRWCNKCQTVKPLDEFFAASAPGLGGYTRYCKACHNARIRDPAKREHYQDYHRRYHLKSKFGITDQEVDRLLAVEFCEACGAPPNGDRFHVDHDHVSGRIRGVLCRRCNYAIGVLEGTERIDAVTAYLARFKRRTSR